MAVGALERVVAAAGLAVRIASLLVLSAMLTGCNTTSTNSGFTRAGSGAGAGMESASAGPVASARDGALRPVGDAATADFNKYEYRLAPLDVIEVSVFQVPDLSKTAAIDGNGLIDLPLIGAVTAGGKTVRELEQEIGKKLGAKYLQSPQVSVFVKEYVSQRVTVEGSVNRPGVYEIKGRATLLQVIAQAGGLQKTASAGNIAVFRDVNGQRQGAVFSLSAIRNNSQSDPVIQAGDYVVVDESVAKAAWRGLGEALGVFSRLTPFL